MPDLVNNFTAIDPATGAITGLFPGGIRILAGDNATPPNSRQIQWVKQSDGSVVCQFITFQQPNFAELDIQVEADQPSGTAIANFTAQGGTNAAHVELNEQATPDPGGLCQAQLFTTLDATHAVTTLLSDHNGKSDFVRQAGGAQGTQKVRMWWGTTSATFPGGTRDTAIVTVTHNLGVTPLVVANAETAGVIPVIFNRNATNFQLAGEYEDNVAVNAGGVVQFQMLALAIG